MISKFGEIYFCDFVLVLFTVTKHVETIRTEWLEQLLYISSLTHLDI